MKSEVPWSLKCKNKRRTLVVWLNKPSLRTVLYWSECLDEIPFFSLCFGFPTVRRQNCEFVSCFLQIREGVLRSSQKSKAAFVNVLVCGSGLALGWGQFPPRPILVCFAVGRSRTLTPDSAELGVSQVQRRPALTNVGLTPSVVFEAAAMARACPFSGFWA